MNLPANFLVIDDDRDDHELFQEALELTFPTVQCYFAFTCTEAIELMENKIIASPDYVFMDWNLPGIQGMDCVEKIRQAIGQAPQLFILTGGGSIIDPLLPTSKLVNGVLFKRASLDQMAKELAAAIKL